MPFGGPSVSVSASAEPEPESEPGSFADCNETKGAVPGGRII